MRSALCCSFFCVGSEKIYHRRGAIATGYRIRTSKTTSSYSFPIRFWLECYNEITVDRLPMIGKIAYVKPHPSLESIAADILIASNRHYVNLRIESDD